MYKILLTLVFLTTSANAQLYNKPISFPDEYTPIKFTRITEGAEMAELKKIWDDVDLPAEYQDKIAYFYHKIDNGNGNYDVITTIYSSLLCGMQNCPLRIATKKYNTFETLLEITSIFTIGDDTAYAIGPQIPLLHRNLFIYGPQYNAIWSFDKEQNKYIQEGKDIENEKTE